MHVDLEGEGLGRARSRRRTGEEMVGAGGECDAAAAPPGRTTGAAPPGLVSAARGRLVGFGFGVE